MPGPGERIGDAYIRIHASGGDIGKEIEKDLDDADRVLSRKGREHGDRYTKEVGRVMARRGWTKAVARDMVKNISDETAVRAGQVNTAFFKSLEKSLVEAEGEDVGRRIFLDIRRGFEKDTKGLVLIKSGDELIEEGPFDRLEQRITREYPAMVEKAENEVLQINRRAAREREALEKEQTRKLEQEQRFRENAVRLAAERQRRYWNETWNEALRMNKEFNRRVQEENEKTRRRFERSSYIININKDVDRLGRTIARVFGKGSRSEFLNFFGRLAGAFTSLVTLPIKVFTNIGSAIANIVGAIREGMGWFEALRGGLGQLGLTIPRLVGGFVALGAAVAVLVFIIGPLISALSLLAGAVTALVGSLTFALIGALGALAAVLVPAIALFGGFVAAFKSLSNQQVGELKAGFQDLTKQFTKSFRKEMPAALEQFKKAMKSTEVKQFADEVGSAVGRTVAAFAKGLNSPTFKQFITAMTDWLPGAVEKLGQAMRNTLGGFGGVLRGMIPFMDDVLDYLVRITEAFSEWANSSKGQHQIEVFFDRTKRSLKAVGGFLGEVTGLIADLFDAGKGSGDDLFKSMKDSIAEFRKFLKDNPDALKNWFEDAKEFARALGDAAVAAGKVMDALDDETSRSEITSFIENFNNMVEGIANGIKKIKEGFSGFKEFISGNPFGAIAEWAKIFDIGDKIESAKEKITGLFSFFSIPKIASLTVSVFGTAALEKVRGWWNSIKDKAASLKATITGFDPLKKAKEAWDGIKNKSAKIKASISNSDLVQSVRDWWAGIKSKAAKIKASISGAKVVENVRNWWVAIKSKAAKISASVSGGKAVEKLKGWWDGIKSKAVKITASISGALKSLFSASGGVLQDGIKVMASGGMLDGAGRRLASGGMANSMQRYGLNNIIGESGREAIVPLDRPLSQIDPSVRALAAFAQGINQNGPGTSIGVDASGWTIVSNAEDPAAVATKVIDRLTAASY
jgi:hypothetical protein